MATSRRCANNHVYDADLYATCPYCSGQGTSIQFGAVPSGGEGGRTVAPGMGQGQSSATVMPGMGQSSVTVMPGMNQMNQMNQAPANPMDPLDRMERTYAPMHQNPEEIGKTVAPQSVMDQQKKDRTVAMFEEEYSMDPVVGWVVCVEGPDQGRSFELMARINTVGRSKEANVVLKDTTVSKIQVKISYDSKHNNFYLIPGESTNNSYLNDNPVFTPTLITAYDLVEIGTTKLIFVPFCSEQFKWGAAPKQGE